MTRAMLFRIALIVLVLLAPGLLYGLTPEESLRKNFPQVRYESIVPSPVQGLYEVVSGPWLLYYSPETENLFIGEIVTKEGRNLTQEKLLELTARKMNDIPLTSALKIGTGAHTVVEFTDPDCSFCRQAEQFFAGRRDVTRYLFFLPAAEHPTAEPKVRYILCAEDKARAYGEAMAGKLDDMKFTLCDDGKTNELLKLHREIGNRVGIRGTPYFSVDGRIVRGANIPLLQEMLDKEGGR